MKKKLVNWWLKRKLRKFFRRLPNSSGLVRIKTIVRERKFWYFSAVELANALTELKEEGLLDQRYQLVREDGSIMGWSFLDPRDIPDTIFDMELDRHVDTAQLGVEIAFVVNSYVPD